MAKEQHDKIAEFDEWTKQILGAAPTRERMRMWLVEAFWHGHLEDTEILRAFRCAEMGVQIVPELSDAGRLG